MKKKVIKIIAWGGLGDVLLSTPAIKALKQANPGSRIVVYYRNKGDLAIFLNNPHIDSLRKISLWTTPSIFVMQRFKLILIGFKPAEFNVGSYSTLSPSISYRKNATEIIAEMFDVEIEDKNVQVYLSEKEIQTANESLSDYTIPVIIQITSLTSKNQHWPIENWEQLIDASPECTFIQLGALTEKKVNGAIDWRGKTSFRQSLALLKSSKSFVGIVSSLAHATNAFNTPGVILFGASAPEVWGHSNNINIYKGLRCAPCIDTLLSSLCPYDKACMRKITVKEVKEALTRQLQAAVPEGN